MSLSNSPFCPFCWQNEIVKLANCENGQNDQNEKCLFSFFSFCPFCWQNGMVKFANWQNEQNEQKCIYRFSHFAHSDRSDHSTYDVLAPDCILYFSYLSFQKMLFVLIVPFPNHGLHLPFCLHLIKVDAFVSLSGI